jgi:hypothetical protein
LLLLEELSSVIEYFSSLFDRTLYIPIANRFITEIDGLLMNPSAAAEAAITAWVFFLRTLLDGIPGAVGIFAEIVNKCQEICGN